MARWEYHVVGELLAPYVKEQSVADIIGFNCDSVGRHHPGGNHPVGWRGG